MIRPACFGLASCVSANSPSCRVCPTAMRCAAAAEAFLAEQPASALVQRERLALSVTRQALSRAPEAPEGGRVGSAVLASSRGVRRLALTPEQLAQIERLPARVGSQVKRLSERGWFQFARGELLAGRNPGTKGWLQVLCAKLLTGPVTRQQLQLAYQQELDMTPASAKMQASVSIAILAAGRIVRESRAGVHVSPD